MYSIFGHIENFFSNNLCVCNLLKLLHKKLNLLQLIRPDHVDLSWILREIAEACGVFRAWSNRGKCERCRKTPARGRECQTKINLVSDRRFEL
jgi:hypothetical protein